MLLGQWKNIEELEECLNIDELRLILDAQRERDLRSQKFQAALKGINLDSAQAQSAEEKFREVEQRVKARLSGQDEKVYELNQLGFDVEIEEEEEQQ